MRQQKHKTCEQHPVKIDWNWLNAGGQPALVCDQCKRKGRAKWITWLNRREVELLKSA